MFSQTSSEKDLGYRDLCNKLTLQSEKRGFFEDWAGQVEILAGPAWIEGFSSISTDRERLVAVYCDSKTREVVRGTLANVQPLSRGKSGLLSQQRRAEAERARAGTARTMALANQAVLRAPLPGVDRKVDEGASLALALWTRSQLFLKKGRPDLALLDVKAALKNSLPQHLKAESYLRMGECYRRLGEAEAAKVALSLAGKLARPPEQEEVKKRVADVGQLQPLSPQPQKHHKPELPKVEGGGSLSSGVKVVDLGGEEGRSAVAVRRISVGEVVVAQPPFAAVLLPDKLGTHCPNCFSRVVRAVGCGECSGAAWCSEECWAAGRSWHGWECAHGELLLGSGMSVLCHLALRLLTQRPLDYFLDLAPRLHDPTFSHPYLDGVYRLVGHEDKREARDMLRRTLMALFLTTVLRDAGYFGKSRMRDGGGELEEEEWLVAGLLLRNLQVLQYNAHEIYETVMADRLAYKSAKTVYIGIGVYPIAAMFNHQCQPTLTRHFAGSSIVLKAVKRVNSGEAIGETYGPVYTMRTLTERRRALLGRYLFTCNCQPCVEDWPKLDDLYGYYRLKCKKEGCEGSWVYKEGVKTWKCEACGERQGGGEQLVRLAKSYEEDLERAVLCLEGGRLEEAVQTLLVVAESLPAVVLPPSRTLALVQETLRSCWADAGNVHVCDT